MKIRLLVIGKLQETWLKEAEQEYRKRLSRFTELEIIELPEAQSGLTSVQQGKLEGEKLLSKISAQDYVIALDLGGTQPDSIAFSAQLEDWFVRGGAKLSFLIAGSNGYSEEVLRRANQRISLSNLTFTHQMARIIFLEQLFRAFKIQRSEAYHK